MRKCPVKRQGVIYKFPDGRGFRVWPGSLQEHRWVIEFYQMLAGKDPQLAVVSFYSYLQAKMENKRLRFEIVDATSKDAGESTSPKVTGSDHA